MMLVYECASISSNKYKKREKKWIFCVCDWCLALKQIKYPKSVCTMWISLLYDTFLSIFHSNTHTWYSHLFFLFLLLLWILWHWQLYRRRYNFFTLHIFVVIYVYMLWMLLSHICLDFFYFISNKYSLVI